MIQRHASWEHRLLGDARTADLRTIAHRQANWQQLLGAERDFLNLWHEHPGAVTEEEIHARYPQIRTITLKRSGLLVTYGELNTLPDYLANPTALDEQPASILLPILQYVRQEGYNRVRHMLGVNSSVAFADSVSDSTWRWTTMNQILDTWKLDQLTANEGPDHTNHYGALLGRNACHFAPFSWYRWQTFYAVARDLATRAHATADPSRRAELTYQAWINHGYADHFLQDSFAAGHLVNKNLVMQWFVEWAADQWYVPVADWDMVKTMTTRAQPALAARGLYNPANPGQVRDPQSAEEQPTVQLRMEMSGTRAHGSTSQATEYQNYLAWLDGTVGQSASGALHDHFNEKSLWVASNAHPTPYQIWGDDTMLNGGDGVGIASETAQMSQQSILEILASGSSSISTQQLLDRFPTKVRSTGNAIVSLEQWNDQQRQFCFDDIFPGVHYYLLRAKPRFGNISVDQHRHIEPGPPWVARHGMTSEEYQEYFNEYVGKGYRLLEVSGYDVGGHDAYAAIWEQARGPAWVAHHRMTSEQYQAFFNQYAKEGYRLVDVSGYTVAGVANYAALWEKSGGRAWVARHGMTGAQYQEFFSQYVRQGYRLRHVSGYNVSGQVYYAAIWDKSHGPAWVAHHDMTSQQYQQFFDEYVRQGYRLTDVSGYEANGAAYYAALWEHRSGPTWVARHGMDARAYQDYFDQYANQGYRLTRVSGYGVSGVDYYAAIWTGS